MKRLDLHGNKLPVVPEIIATFTNLTYLGLDYNKIKLLPEWIGQLVHLETLNLEKNRLQMVPEELGQLLQLETLNLSRNKLFTLPPVLTNLSNLTKLLLERNPLPDGLGRNESNPKAARKLLNDIAKLNMPKTREELLELELAEQKQRNEQLETLVALLRAQMKAAGVAEQPVRNDDDN